MSWGETAQHQKGWIGVVLVTVFLLRGWAHPCAYAEEEIAKEIDPEKAKNQERIRAMNEALKSVSKPHPPEEVREEELKRYKSELLRRPKRKRLSIGYDTDATYMTNRSGAKIHYEKGNSGFHIIPSVSWDFSKRKTDMKLEYRWNRFYNNKTPEADNFSQELSFRGSRKIFRKTTLSLNDRLTRNSVRVANFDNKKIDFNNSHRQSLSYEFNPKLSFNLETNHTSTAFVDENFDQDGSLDFQIDSNAAFQLTRKTRVTAGYQLSNPRSHAHTSDVTNHGLRFGYSGKITPKSSISADFSWTIQDPIKAQASNSKKYSSSVSYLWQMTPKTGLRLIYSNSYSYAISDSVSGRALLKSVNYSSSNTWGMSVRFRAHRRINAEFSFNPSHADSKTKQTGAANTKSRSFTFPIQVGLDIELWRGIRFRLTYTYRHKIGDEMKTDENRTHTWFAGTNYLF